ncbi:MAG: hypothetical protein Kow0090_19490 [Myxococcota bacterium]
MEPQNDKKREFRNFGLSLGIALLIITTLIFHFKGFSTGAKITTAIALFLLISGLFFPLILAPFHFVWMKFAAGLAWLNSRILLTLIYLLFFVPVGLLLSIFGRDPLKIKDFRKKESYWIKREKPLGESERYKKQF